MGDEFGTVNVRASARSREIELIRQHYRGMTKLNSLRTDEMEARFPGLLPAVVTAAETEA